eukprot:gene1677-3242_t
MSRPLVSIYDPSSSETVVSQTTLPSVLTAPIRSDIVQFTFSQISKNKRQPYAVYSRQGHETAAVSWGTGRAVSRIPRVHGGGTQRSGQGAYGNMCRGGRMFGHTKIWRRWHRHVSVNQRRFAVASALAATAVPALVMARGHRIDEVPEVPLVLDDSLNNFAKTKDAKALLERFGAYSDVEKVSDSRKVRCGQGKARNRRYVQRRGPLVIYDTTNGIDKAFRNLPGVELTQVDNLSLFDLAPGGHLGRFCIWTKGAFQKLDTLFGSTSEESQLKKGYKLPFPMMANADLARLINSDEIQSVIRPAITSTLELPKKRNPLKNHSVMVGLNPYAAVVKARSDAKLNMNKAAKEKLIKAKREELTVRKALKGRRKAFYRAASKEGEIAF